MTPTVAAAAAAVAAAVSTFRSSWLFDWQLIAPGDEARHPRLFRKCARIRSASAGPALLIPLLILVHDDMCRHSFINELILMWIYLRWNPVGCWYLLAFRLQWVHARCTFPLPSSLPLSLPPIVPMSMILRTLTVDSSRDSLTRKNSRGAIVSFAAFVSKEMENGEWRFLKDASKIVKDSERNVPGILFREIESEKFSNSRRIVHILVKFWLSPYYFLRRKGKRRGEEMLGDPSELSCGILRILEDHFTMSTISLEICYWF